MVDRGPLDEFEVIWRNGHIDRFRAHQVTYPGNSPLFTYESDGVRVERIEFHGEIDGHWRLMLSADRSDILSVRNVSQIKETLQ